MQSIRCATRATADQARHEYQLDLAHWKDVRAVDALVLAVAHREFLRWPLGELLARVVPGGCVIDVKSRLDKAAIEARGFRVWRL